jgi:hypothetical protein
MTAWAGIELAAAPTTRRNAETTNSLFIKGSFLSQGLHCPFRRHSR